MKAAGAFRWTVAAAVLAAMLASALSFRADAQSEYMRGDRMPYDAFDRLPRTDLEVPGGTIHVAFAPGDMTLPREKLLGWIRMSARAVTTYYGRFPVHSLRLLLVPVDGGRIRGGTTWGYRGAAIRIPLGRDSTEDVLQRDWVMVHEMVHTALPDMPDRYAWLSEGLAVYVEPVARVQAGDLSAREIWQAMMRDMPKGLPQAGDQGLDNTPTWGRRYWGGAMFCLLADIEIRKRTNNRAGLQDAMRGVLAAGGNHEQDWPIERILATADKAVGVDVMTRLHDEMGPKPVTPDLAALWRDLGLKRIGEDLEFDDAAPLAAIRKAITAPHVRQAHWRSRRPGSNRRRIIQREASEPVAGADAHEMHLVAEFSPRAVLAGQRDAAIIGVEIFAAPDEMLGESILEAAAHDQSGLDLFVPDRLLQGVAPLLDRIAVAVADAGEADTDRTIRQQAVERVAGAQARGAECAEARQQRAVAEDEFVP